MRRRIRNFLPNSSRFIFIRFAVATVKNCEIPLSSEQFLPQRSEGQRSPKANNYPERATSGDNTQNLKYEFCEQYFRLEIASADFISLVMMGEVILLAPRNGGMK